MQQGTIIRTGEQLIPTTKPQQSNIYKSCHLSCKSLRSFSPSRRSHGVRSASGSCSLDVHPLPRYPKRFSPASYVYSKSSHLGSRKTRVKCEALPGHTPWMRAPGLPPLYHELHLRLMLVRGKKASQYATKSSVARFEGVAVRIPWEDILRSSFAIYVVWISAPWGTVPDVPGGCGPLVLLALIALEKGFDQDTYQGCMRN
jgi:hypothetical protein